MTMNVYMKKHCVMVGPDELVYHVYQVEMLVLLDLNSACLTALLYNIRSSVVEHSPRVNNI